MTQQASFLIALNSSSPQIDLDDELEMTVTLSPNGYSGTVDLAIKNLGNGGIPGISRLRRSPSTGRRTSP